MSEVEAQLAWMKTQDRRVVSRIAKLAKEYDVADAMGLAGFIQELICLELEGLIGPGQSQRILEFVRELQTTLALGLRASGHSPEMTQVSMTQVTQTLLTRAKEIRAVQPSYTKALSADEIAPLQRDVEPARLSDEDHDAD